MQATGVTLANATGVRLEFFKTNSKGLLKDDIYKPPPTLEPGEVASFLVDTSVFDLKYNIQTFQGPMDGWVAGDATKTVSVQGKNSFSTSINAFLQVDPKPPGYPTKFTFDVSRNDGQWQINAKQSFFIKGIKSFAQEVLPTAPPGFLSENTNQGFSTGFYVYCAPVYGVSEDEACTGFQLLFSGDAGNRGAGGLPPFSTDDLAKGTGGEFAYRYITPLRTGGKKVTSISWGTNHTAGPQTTGDLNSGRGGRDLSLDWSYD